MENLFVFNFESLSRVVPMKLAVLAVVALTASCIAPPDFSTCPTGTRLAEVRGEEGCFLACSDDNDCPSNESCIRTICVPPTSAPDSSDAGSDVPIQDGVRDESLDELCELAAQKIFDCVLTECNTTTELEAGIADVRDVFINGDATVESCAETLADDTESREVFRQISNFTCDESSLLRCGGLRLYNFCECAQPTNIGNSCNDESDCTEEDLYGGCNEGAPGGYCVAFDCPSPPANFLGYPTDACGAGNVCVRFDEESAACLKGCSTNNDCRSEYACELVGAALDFSGPAKACTPRCTDDSDCEGACENGACQFPCLNTTGEDICTAAGGSCVGGVTQFCTLL